MLDINGKSLDEASGVTAAPNPLNGNTARPYGSGTGGFNPPYVDDSSQHYSDHGPFSDERVSFPGSLLHAGKNTLTVTMNAKSGIAYLMVDYLRLELTGYIPPAPASVTAHPGNNRVLVRWPVVPGATSYNVLRAAGWQRVRCLGGDRSGGSGVRQRCPRWRTTPTRPPPTERNTLMSCNRSIRRTQRRFLPESPV